jgi:hypothetical protein
MRIATRTRLIVLIGFLCVGCVAYAVGTWGRPAVGGEVTTAQVDLLYRAEQVLVRDCMARHGFTIALPSADPVADDRAFPYVVDDVGWASRHGYGRDIQQQAERSRDADPNGRYLRSLPPARRAAALAALNGPRPVGLRAVLPDGAVATHSDQGCTAEAERDLYHDLETWFRAYTITRNLPRLWQSQVVADPGFAAATAEWAGCMKQHGYLYATPVQSRAAALDPKAPLPHDREVALAVAEATCATGTSLAATANALDDRYATQVRARYHNAVSDRQRLEHGALGRARSIIARA